MSIASVLIAELCIGGYIVTHRDPETVCFHTTLYCGSASYYGNLLEHVKINCMKVEASGSPVYGLQGYIKLEGHVLLYSGPIISIFHIYIFDCTIIGMSPNMNQHINY